MVETFSRDAAHIVADLYQGSTAIVFSMEQIIYVDVESRRRG